MLILRAHPGTVPARAPWSIDPLEEEGTGATKQPGKAVLVRTV